MACTGARSPHVGSSVGLAAASVLLGLVPLAAAADHIGGTFDHGAIATATEENDFVNGTDRWYTQGARLSYLQADNDVPGWTHRLLDTLPALGFSTGAERIGYEFGQSIFTPANTHSSQLRRDDRPYAGYLYGALALQRRGFGFGDVATLENLQLQVGIIGPESFAGQMQTWYHHHAPQGWEYQLRDEPAVALKYGRAWLIPWRSSGRRYVDWIPQGGVSIGNTDTSVRAGATFRFGVNLPDDFGVQPINSLLTTDGGWSAVRQARPYGFYLFSGVEGRAVLYTAFLDGNAFQDSHHVDKEYFVGEWRSGLVLSIHRLELAYTHVLQTREFETQPAGHAFGSITLRVNF